nr:unnamed protein product [Callosobruchus analis]
MNLINFHWIQNAPYTQRSFLRSLKQWSSSLARNLTPILSVAIREVQLPPSETFSAQIHSSRKYLIFIPFLIINQSLLYSYGVQAT